MQMVHSRSMANILTIIGLILDIIGAYILYKHGAIGDILNAIEGAVKIKDPNFKTEENTSLKNSKIGFALLVVGFFFQFLAALLGLYNVPNTPSGNCCSDNTQYESNVEKCH